MAEKKGKEQKQIGIVSNYFDHVNAAAIKLTDSLKAGETIRIVGGEIDFEQEVGEMQIQHEKINSAKSGDEIGLKIKERVRKGYKVFRV